MSPCVIYNETERERAEGGEKKTKKKKQIASTNKTRNEDRVRHRRR